MVNVRHTCPSAGEGHAAAVHDLGAAENWLDQVGRMATLSSATE